jgi:hypothetical protein
MSLLSALLTQDQVVSPKAIDEAIQRQVINGGDFETNLLEIGAIAEDTLAAYCAAIHGLAVCPREDVIHADPSALARIPAHLAEQHRVVALRIERARLVVCLAGPLSSSARSELEAAARMPVDARCVTSVRVGWALWRYYETEFSSRLQRLMTRLHTVAPGPIPTEVTIPLTRSKGTSLPVTSLASTVAVAALDAALMEEEASDVDGVNPLPRRSIFDGFDHEESVLTLPPREPLPLPSRLQLEDRESTPTDISHRPTQVVPDSLLAALATDPSALRTIVPTGDRSGEYAEIVTDSPYEPPVPLFSRDESTSPSVFSAPTRPTAIPAPMPSRDDTELVAVEPPPEASTTLRSGLSIPPPQIDAIDFEDGEYIDVPVPPSTRPIPSAIQPLSLSGLSLNNLQAAITTPSAQSAPHSELRWISLEEATQRIQAASDRNGVVEALLDHLHGQFVYVAVFVVNNHQLAGHASRGDGCVVPTLLEIKVSLTEASAMRAAYESLAPEVAVIEPNTPEQKLRDLLQRTEVTEALIVPIRVGTKAALVLWADKGQISPSALAMRQVSTFVRLCGDAFVRIIASKKRPAARDIHAHISSITAPPVKTTPPRQTIPDRISRLDVLRRTLGDTGQRTSQNPATIATSPPTPPRNEECVRLLTEATSIGSWNDTDLSALVSFGEEGLSEVFALFPGRHTLNRKDPFSKLPAAMDAGPILRAVTAFRDASLPRLIAILSNPDVETRFCALMCLAEVVHASAIPSLIDRLTDTDYPTRMAAIEVVKAYRRLAEFELVGRSLRAILRNNKASPEARRASAHALGEFRDTESAVSLITVLTDSDAPLVAAAHRALVVLTRQDFGTNPAPWLEWWDRAATKHRMEWLIDSLMHQEPTIRHEASEELKRMTGQYFGYFFNLPRRERERAQQQYIDWWQTEGLTRFSMVPMGR